MIYSTRLIAVLHRWNMIKPILVVFLVITLFPISMSFSQLADTKPTLGIKLTSSAPYNFKDESGHTVVIGEVENTKNFPVTAVKIFVGFYDDLSEQPLETAIGTTILDVIPPLGKSPYVIKSPSKNSAITSVSVNLLGFNSSPQKQKQLSLDTGTLNIANELTLTGKITNNGLLPSSDNKIYLISYDSFQPPRVLHVATEEVAKLDPGASANFNFDAPRNMHASTFRMIAESNNYQSDLLLLDTITPDLPTKLVTINDITVQDLEGNRLSDVTAGSIINLQSRILIQFAQGAESINQPYVYWVQIKQSGEKPIVEFIGKAEGTFESGGTQFPTVEWQPQREGLYFVETFVWNPVGIPLASKGPISLILVN